MNVFCLFCFLGFARKIFYPALFAVLHFKILVVMMRHKKNQDKNEQFNVTYDQF